MGTFECICPEGKSIDENHVCQDEDECSAFNQGQEICPHGKCINRDPGMSAVCLLFCKISAICLHLQATSVFVILVSFHLKTKKLAWMLDKATVMLKASHARIPWLLRHVAHVHWIVSCLFTFLKTVLFTFLIKMTVVSSRLQLHIKKFFEK